jgi:hypothetical protein
MHPHRMAQLMSLDPGFDLSVQSLVQEGTGEDDLRQRPVSQHMID